MDNVPEHFYNRLEIRGLHFCILNSQNYKITETGLQHVTPQSVCTPVREWSEDHFFIFLKIFGHDATGFVFHHFACVLLCHRVHGFSAVVTIDISWPPACPLSTVTQSRYTVR